MIEMDDAQEELRLSATQDIEGGHTPRRQLLWVRSRLPRGGDVPPPQRFALAHRRRLEGWSGGKSHVGLG